MIARPVRLSYPGLNIGHHRKNDKFGGWRHSYVALGRGFCPRGCSSVGIGPALLFDEQDKSMLMKAATIAENRESGRKRGIPYNSGLGESCALGPLEGIQDRGS